MITALPDLDNACSQHFCFREIIEVGETWHKYRPDNVPQQPSTYQAIEDLCTKILDPVVEVVGWPTITYGFSSRALARLVKWRISPELDQHAGHELKVDGGPICPRLGQAVDIRVQGLMANELAGWLVREVPFDRLYLYGDDQPVHVSFGPEHSAAIVRLRLGPGGRRIPIKVHPDELG